MPDQHRCTRKPPASKEYVGDVWTCAECGARYECVATAAFLSGATWLRMPEANAALELPVDCARPGTEESERTGEPEPGIRISISRTLPAQNRLAGTTTFTRDAANALAERHQLAVTEAPLDVNALLYREPENAVDDEAVAVSIEGERVGYVPSVVTRALALPVGGAKPVPARVFAAFIGESLRTEIWVWLGEGEPAWTYSAENRPAMSPREKRLNRARRAKSLVEDALVGGGRRAEDFRAGMSTGIHYLESVEPIQELKRRGRLRDALELCYIATEGAEGASARSQIAPPPFYTIQAAIIHRKLGERDREIAVLRRWIDRAPETHRHGGPVPDRLRKLEARSIAPGTGDV